jgi:hypothetical protein
MDREEYCIMTNKSLGEHASSVLPALMGTRPSRVPPHNLGPHASRVPPPEANETTNAGPNASSVLPPTAGETITTNAGARPSRVRPHNLGSHASRVPPHDLGPRASRVPPPVAHETANPGPNASSVPPPATKRSATTDKVHGTSCPATSLPYDVVCNRSSGTTVRPLHNTGQRADVRPFSAWPLPHAPTFNGDNITAVSRLQNSRRKSSLVAKSSAKQPKVNPGSRRKSILIKNPERTVRTV